MLHTSDFTSCFSSLRLISFAYHNPIQSIHFTHAWSLTKGVRSRSIPHSNQSNAWPCSDLAGKLNSSPTPCACCSFEWFEHSIVFLSKWPLIRNMDTLYYLVASLAIASPAQISGRVSIEPRYLKRSTWLIALHCRTSCSFAANRTQHSTIY